MKKLFFILAILIFLNISYFSYVNSGQLLELNYKPIIDSFKLDSGLVYLIVSLQGILCGILLCNGKIQDLNKKLKKNLRKTERVTVDSEESFDRAKVLEAKIETLEAALKQALKK